jgi:hypothetical protein
MKDNRSLQLSIEINELMDRDLASIFYEFYPFKIIEQYKKFKERDRVYNPSNTMLTMIITMMQADKSLQNSVNIYNTIHNKNRERITEIEIGYQQSIKQTEKRKRGRPSKHRIKVQKSKKEEISRNTSAYTQARQRLSIELSKAVFRDSVRSVEASTATRFYGREVYLTDGTFLQLQDTELIREKYKNSTQEGYPRGLLEVIVQQDTGLITNFEIESDKKSELELLNRMISGIKPKSLLLADDLYNCFSIFVKLKKQGVDIIVPGKRKRIYRIIEKIAQGDEIVRIASSNETSKMYKKFNIKEKSIEMRRIQVANPNNEKEDIVLYTSLLDKKISKEEILIKYLTRWDIEINIREIKAILGMNVIRSKSPEMIVKEVTSGLIAYNYIRRIIANSALKGNFSPETDIFQKFYQTSSTILLDRLGRVYSRWSPGRYGGINKTNNEAQSIATSG